MITRDVISARTSKSTLYLLTNGVVVIEVNDNVTIEVEDIRDMVKAQGELTSGKKSPVVTVPGEFTNISKEARDFMAGKEAAQFTLADGFVIRALAQKILADFYMRFQHPIVPTKIFRKKEEAIKWAEKFVTTK